jgi:hypothetical protein
MSRRLQVILDDEELREIEHAAARERMTTSEWVRQALRARRREQPRVEARRKLARLRAAVRHAFPTADIDDMLREIERGRMGGDH